MTIARSSTSAFQSTYKLFSERYGAGITSRLAVTRAESALAEATGSVADVERQISIKEHQICILLGRNPGTIQRDPPKDAAQIPPAIPAGLPSWLLERRPDLLQAEQVLAGASARIGIAKADFFPRIGLTALFGRVSPDLLALTGGSATVAALAGGAAGPIFTGGQLTGSTERPGLNSTKQSSSICRLLSGHSRRFPTRCYPSRNSRNSNCSKNVRSWL